LLCFLTKLIVVYSRQLSNNQDKSMRKLSQKEWIGVVVGLVIISVYFFNRSFIFSFLTAPLAVDSGAQVLGTKTDGVQDPNMEQSTLKKDVTLYPGLTVKDFEIGTGKMAVDGSIVSVNYLGYLTNGEQFDSSYDTGKPLEFQIGLGQLIPGFEGGVIGMQVGGKRKITIAPELGYGEAGSPPRIPPNSTLIFDVELVEVK